MPSPKFFIAVNSLTKEEWSSFRIYLLSKTRRDSDNFTCYTALSKNKNHLLEEGLDEMIRKKHFSKMSPKVFSNLLSRMFVWFEEWYSIYTFQNQDHEKELSLIRGYNQRGLFKLADQHFIKLEKKLNQEKSLNLEQGRARSELYQLMYYSNNPIKGNSQLNLFENCISSFLKYAVEQSSIRLLELRNKTLYKDRDFGQYENELIAFSNSSANSSCNEIIKETVDLLKNKSYEKLIALVNKLEEGIITKSSDLYLILTTMTSRVSTDLWNNNKIKDAKILIQSSQLQFDALVEHKHFKLLPVHFFNQVTTIAEFASYEETDKFITDSISMLHTKYPDSALKYCQAINEYRHENYDKVPELLNGLQLDEYIHGLIGNCMLIISHFELGEHDLLHTLIHNFRKQLKRNKSTNSRLIIEGMINLTKVILKLEDVLISKKPIPDLSTYSPLFFRSWVQKKIEQ